MTTLAELPRGLIDNPRLDQWVCFRPSDRAVVISTGKVEIGQGVLTAMRQIAAEELDVALEQITMQSGDTALTPNEGYTAGSQSIQYGGVALRVACAEVRDLFLRRAAEILECKPANLSIRDGIFLIGRKTTSHDYWTLSRHIDLNRPATGQAIPKPVTAYGFVGRNIERIDLAAKVFGQAVFIHDMTLDGMLHARVLRQPAPTASLATIDETAIRRAAKEPIEIVRHGNFLAIVGENETAVEAAAGATGSHVAWQGAEPVNAHQAEARWLLQQPSKDLTRGAPEPAGKPRGASRYEASYSRPYVAHASVAPSCGLALFQDGHLQVWTHSQGVYPLRAALAHMLKLEATTISVKHVQGPGCYGHNGADDAAADAAVIATLMPGRPIRVRWRREEEFGFEPVSPAMTVTVRAELDEDGKPLDWTTEIWSGTHGARPGAHGGLLAETALPARPPLRSFPGMPAAGGGGTRNGEPLYDLPGMRVLHHHIPEIPVRTSALRGLGATANVFAIESFIDELAEHAGQDPVAYRLSLLSDVRARAVIEHVAKMCGWQPGIPAGTGEGCGIGFARYKNQAAYAAVVARVAVEEEIRVLHVWCAADAGLLINPDGAINQLEGNIVQAVSWALKEQVRLEGAGISSRDWDSYPVLRFTDVPEVTVEMVNPKADLPALGVGEAGGGPTVAAIGNAVAHALGARLRDLPLTRERVMAALLAD